jgi:hypothetical protein
MAHRLILAAAATFYLLLSLACIFMPSVLPTTIMGGTFTGPPLLLIWGRAIWPLYACVTSTLATLVVVAVKSRSPELSVISGWAAAVVWAAGSFFSVALSV